jgi:hypothetical protein
MEIAVEDRRINLKCCTDHFDASFFYGDGKLTIDAVPFDHRLKRVCKTEISVIIVKRRPLLFEQDANESPAVETNDKSDEDGSCFISKEIVYRRIGMENLGNTWFINSLCQVEIFIILFTIYDKILWIGQ